MGHERKTGLTVIAGLLLAGCTTVTPPVATHPGKTLEAQNEDKAECWMNARVLTGHDPEGSSRGGRILAGVLVGGAAGYLGVRHSPAFLLGVPAGYGLAIQPSPQSAVVAQFREAYVACLTQRGFSVEGARPGGR